MAQMLEIKIKFDRVPQNEFEQNMGGAKKAVDKFWNKTYLDAGRNANMDLMEDLENRMEKFDWAHPFESAKKRISSVFGEFMNKTGVLGGLLIGVVIAFGKRLLDLVRIQPQLTEMFSMLASNGERMSKRVSRAMHEITDVALLWGAGLDEVAKIYTDLGQARVPVEDLKEMSELSWMGAKALGANVGQVTQLVANLKVMGKMSNEQTKNMIAGFGRVQDAVGLTENEMSGLISTVSKLTQYLAGMDASSNMIQRMGEEAATLVGVYGSLGLETSSATALMEKLFDPSRMQENLLLINRMGISMQDYTNMLAGTGDSMPAITEGLWRAANEVKNLAKNAHPVVAQAWAAKLGFSSLAEATKLAGKSLKEINELQEKQKEGRKLTEQAAEAMSNLGEMIGRIKNIFLAVFAKAAIPIIEVLTEQLNKVYTWWTANSARLKPVLDKLTESLMGMADQVIKFLDNILKNPDAIITFFENMIKGIQNFIKGVSWLIKNWWIIPVIIAALVAAGPLIGKALGQGIAGGMKALDKVGPMAILTLLAIAAAIIGLAFAATLFVKAVKDLEGKIGQFAAVIGIMVGAMILLGVAAALLGALGPIAILGAAALLLIAAAMLVAAVAFNIFADAALKLAQIDIMTWLEMAGGLLAFAAALAAAAPMMLLAGVAMIIFGPALLAVAAAAKTLGEAFVLIEPRIETVGEQLKQFKEIGNDIRGIKGPLKDIGAGFRELGKGINEVKVGRMKKTLDQLTAYGQGIRNIAGAISELAAIDITEDFVNKMKLAEKGLARVASVKGIEEKSGGFLGGIVKGISSLLGTPTEAEIRPVVRGTPDLGDLTGAGRAEVEMTRLIEMKMENVVTAIREEFSATRDAEQRMHDESMLANSGQYNELRKIRRTSSATT